MLEFNFRLRRRDFTMELKGHFSRGITGIFGPSGAGKTSFFKVLAGLDHPHEGHVKLHGKTLVDPSSGISIPPHKRRIGVVFQEKLLFPHMTVRKNLLFGQTYAPVKAMELDRVVDLLDLGGLLKSMPHEISGGEQQRCAVGRALMTSPELLLMDEPFNGLDQSLRLSMLPYLKRLGQELDLPMLVISHDLSDLQRLTNRIYLIDRGKSRGFGSPHSLLLGEDSPIPLDSFVNVLPLENPQAREGGEFCCKLLGAPDIPIISAQISGQQFHALLSPGDVALSREHIPNISMQNQIPGRVERIQEHSLGFHCFIDVGIPLTAYITHHAMNQLDLKTGDPVFCLFKAHSLTL